MYLNVRDNSSSITTDTVAGLSVAGDEAGADAGDEAGAWMKKSCDSERALIG